MNPQHRRVVEICAGADVGVQRLLDPNMTLALTGSTSAAK
jgi:hypothetical protein